MRSEYELWLIYAKDKMKTAEKRGTPQFTGFLEKTKAVRFKQGKIWGGYEQAERVMLGFFPEFSESFDFPITALEISYNPRFGKKLSHRDFLGSVLGLGIVREKTGDIIVLENRAVMFVCSEMADYIITNLESVGKTKVTVQKALEIPDFNRGGTEKKLSLSSLRLDNFISAGFNVSRSKSAEMIKSKKVFINHIEETNVSKIVKEGDDVSLRGFGKIKFLNIEGKTKKDKFIINIHKYG